MARCCNFY